MNSGGPGHVAKPFSSTWRRCALPGQVKQVTEEILEKPEAILSPLVVESHLKKRGGKDTNIWFPCGLMGFDGINNEI